MLNGAGSSARKQAGTHAQQRVRGRLPRGPPGPTHRSRRSARCGPCCAGACTCRSGLRARRGGRCTHAVLRAAGAWRGAGLAAALHAARARAGSTVEGRALVAPVRLLHNHDVHSTRQVGRDGVHAAEQRGPAVREAALRWRSRPPTHAASAPSVAWRCATRRAPAPPRPPHLEGTGGARGLAASSSSRLRSCRHLLQRCHCRERAGR